MTGRGERPLARQHGEERVRLRTVTPFFDEGESALAPERAGFLTAHYSLLTTHYPLLTRSHTSSEASNRHRYSP